MAVRYHKLRLKSDRTDALERRHPWVFSGALIQEDLLGLEGGEPVELTSYEGNFLARGYYERGSIAVRVFTYDQECELDDSFWHQKLSEALRLRKSLGLLSQESTTCRLVNGEGDGLPGLVVDAYGAVLVLQSETIAVHQRREYIQNALLALLGDRVEAIYYKPEQERLLRYEGVQYGTMPEEEDFIVSEGALRFVPDVRRGQKTGYFLEHRENRRLVRQLAQERKVLDLFACMGGFSTAALLGGADRVVSVDSSSRAITLLQSQMTLNFSPDLIQARHQCEAQDAFEYIKGVPHGEYDLIILDPPPLARRRAHLKNGLQAYRTLNTEALRAMAPAGLLLTFSSSQAVSMEQFRQNVFTSALLAERRVRLLSQLGASPDFPVSIYHPEGEYLKGLLLYVE